MQAAPEKSANSEASLQLVLFVDKRSSTRKPIQDIRSHLEALRVDYPFELTIVDVGEQPYLAEHYRLVATPALIKVHPKPQQTIAGSNLLAQLESWWPRWLRSLEDDNTGHSQDLLALPRNSSSSSPKPLSPANSLASSVELIRLSDEVFRLKQEKEELIDQLQFKDQVISMLAHDLRSPLTAASIALETLGLDGQSLDNGHRRELTSALKARLLQQARTQLRTIDRMITDLLQAARGSNTDLKIRPHKLQLGKFCHDVLAQIKEQFRLKSQKLETDIPQDLPCVYADEELIRQVLVNLLDNAYKYTPEGSTIRVSMLHRTTQKIQVSVCDDGPGIPEEDRDSIFEGHFRLKRDEAQQGYGLGLSLCQKIVRAHYGQIWVDAGSKGGCFHFTLPIYR